LVYCWLDTIHLDFHSGLFRKFVLLENHTSMWWKFTGKNQGSTKNSATFNTNEIWVPIFQVFMMNCTAAFCLRSFYFISMLFYHVYLLIFGFCPIKKFHCALFVEFLFGPTIVVYLSLFFIGIDRLWSTKNKNKSNIIFFCRFTLKISILGDVDKMDLGTIFLLVFSWVASFVFFFGIYLTGSSSLQQENYVCYCYVVAIFPKNGSINATIVVMLLQLGSIFMYYIVYKVNQK